MRQAIAVLVLSIILFSACKQDPGQRLFSIAISEFDAHYSIKTLLKNDPKYAESEIETDAGGQGWTLRHTEAEIVDLQNTGHITCHFIANQIYFLKNTHLEAEAIVNKLWVYDGGGWRMLSIWVKKSRGEETLSEENYNEFDRECNP